MVRDLATALALALLWAGVSAGHYRYNHHLLGRLLGLSLYPVVAWTLGLFTLSLFFRRMNRRLDRWPRAVRFFAAVLFYWVALISLESLFYHVLGVRNLGTAAYSSLPLCQCLHAPKWMQAAYFLLGPVYLAAIGDRRATTAGGPR